MFGILGGMAPLLPLNPPLVMVEKFDNATVVETQYWRWTELIKQYRALHDTHAEAR